LYDHKPKPHLHAFAIALWPLRTLTHCDCHGRSSDSAAAATPDAKAASYAGGAPAASYATVDLIPDALSLGRLWQRARIVFDCRIANDPAMMSSTNPAHV
jgi:hypothetical protein